MKTTPTTYETYTARRRAHWDAVARKFESGPRAGRSYHRRLGDIYRSLIAPGQRVLELGCGPGDLLAACEPVEGVGVDFSGAMLQQARARHPSLTFVHSDILEYEPDGIFDVVIMSDLVNDIWDVQGAFETASRAMGARSRLILNLYSRVWEPGLRSASRFGLARPLLPQNWLALDEIRDLLSLAGMEEIRRRREILLPLSIPGMQTLANKFLVRFWPFYHLALTNFVLARPLAGEREHKTEHRVSVVVPVRNEAGNIPAILESVPEIGAGTELIFVEGHSTDRSYEVLQEEIKKHPSRSCVLLQQPGVGKGDAVRHGFSHASGEALLILDADLTVAPGDLVRFYETLKSRKGEMVNGVRLTYPMGDRAMRFFNLIGNRLFSVLLSWMLGQPIKDTLCGTKAIWKSDYELITGYREYFGDFDPFGDFELILGAAKLNLRILDLPVRYHDRTYGETNIQRWRHGWMLVKMVFVASRKILFV
ncbi:MAG: glycosyltransferase [Anaerolineales bacterium]